MSNDFEYDLSYWDLMLKQNSTSAEMINKIRWEFVAKIHPRKVLDYGSGPGWFKAFRPPGIKVDTFDIAPWPQTGIKENYYDLITFWDVIEHFDNLTKYLGPKLTIADYVAGTTPILPKGQKLNKWKHFKPGEHHQYFTEETLEDFFKKYDFRLIKKGYPECPPRTNIISFIFKKESRSIY